MCASQVSNALYNGPATLYYWLTPNGWKAPIILEELGAPYDVNSSTSSTPTNSIPPDGLTEQPHPAFVDPYGPKGEPLSTFALSGILGLILLEKHRPAMAT